MLLKRKKAQYISKECVFSSFDKTSYLFKAPGLQCDHLNQLFETLKRFIPPTFKRNVCFIETQKFKE